MFETSGVKLVKLRIRIKNKWIKKIMFKRSYEESVTAQCLLPFYTPSKHQKTIGFLIVHKGNNWELMV